MQRRLRRWLRLRPRRPRRRRQRRRRQRRHRRRLPFLPFLEGKRLGGESSSRGGAGGGGGGGGGGTAAAAVSWRGGRMCRPPLRFVGASGFLMPPLAPCPRSRRVSLWTCGSDDSRESRRDDIWGRKRGVPRRGEGRRRRASGKMSSEEEEKRLSRSRALSPARSSSPILA